MIRRWIEWHPLRFLVRNQLKIKEIGLILYAIATMHLRHEGPKAAAAVVIQFELCVANNGNIFLVRFFFPFFE
jgi:hypothetical protein